MKVLAITALFGLTTSSLLAADAAADIQAAAKKLGDKPNYSWTAKTETQGPAREGDREGKTEKNGFSLLSFTVREDQVQALVKGDKAVIKVGESWQTAESLAESDDQENRRMRGLARRLQQFKPPHVEAQDLAKNVKELKKDEDGAYSGDLTPAGLKEVFGRGFRRPGGGGEGPDTSGLKGKAKFWVKDGVLSKFSNQIEGSMKLGERDVDIDRTTTVEIKEVGTTKVTVPEDAKKKLSR